MLKKKVNIKGLKKKILNFEYEKDLLAQNNLIKSESCNIDKNIEVTLLSEKKSTLVDFVPLLDRDQTTKEVVNLCKNLHVNFRILILRSEPIKQKIDLNLLNGNEFVKNVRLHSKCIKKSVLKKTVLNLVSNQNTLNKNWLKCKYIYWITPDAVSLKEQFIHLNLLKNYLRAEPKDAFLGCLIESRFNESIQEYTTQKNQKFCYKYYYPAQVLDICDSIDKLGGLKNSTGLEILGQLFYTLDTSVNSLSNILCVKKESLEKNN